MYTPPFKSGAEKAGAYSAAKGEANDHMAAIPMTELARIGAAVFRAKWKPASGKGEACATFFLATKEGVTYLFTNQHVGETISDTTDVELLNETKHLTCTTTLIKFRTIAEWDVAAFHVPQILGSHITKNVFVPLQFEPLVPPMQSGMQVAVVGHPNGQGFAHSTGKITVEKHADGVAWAYNASTLPGSSGSPVFFVDEQAVSPEAKAIQTTLRLVAIHAVSGNSGTPLRLVFNELDKNVSEDAPVEPITLKMLTDTFMGVEIDGKSLDNETAVKIAKFSIALLSGSSACIYGLYHLWKRIRDAEGSKKVFLIVLFIVAVIVAIFVGLPFKDDLAGILEALSDKSQSSQLPPGAVSFASQ